MITISQQYGYPIASVLSTFYLLAFQMATVGKARKASGIAYPRMYAELAEMEKSKAANVFNCAQRAHQNTLESLPVVIVTTLVAGLQYPTLAASACGAWTFFRVLYTIGYTSGDPARRNVFGANGLGTVSLITLLLTATWTTVQLVFDLA